MPTNDFMQSIPKLSAVHPEGSPLLQKTRRKYLLDILDYPSQLFLVEDATAPKGLVGSK